MELAPSLRHELNNPLALVSGNLSLAQKKCGQLVAELPEHKRDSLLVLSRLLGQAQTGAERIAELVRQGMNAALPGSVGAAALPSVEGPPAELLVPTLLVKPELPTLPAAEYMGVATSQRRPSVLVIDDEALMCELLCCLLEDDYRATGIPHAHRALKRLLEGESFDIVLCDLMMPELSGMDLYAQLLSHRPAQAARFIFMTGGTFTERATKFLEQLPDPPLIKPFGDAPLRKAIEARLRELGPIGPEGSVTA